MGERTVWRYKPYDFATKMSTMNTIEHKMRITTTKEMFVHSRMERIMSALLL